MKRHSTSTFVSELLNSWKLSFQLFKSLRGIILIMVVLSRPKKLYWCLSKDCISQKFIVISNECLVWITRLPRGFSNTLFTLWSITYLLVDNESYWLPFLSAFHQSIKNLIDSLNLVNIMGNKIFALIDCTYIKCAKPNDRFTDRAFYTKHKTLHGLKFQVIMLPNGMVYSCFPSSAHRHDSTVHRDSQALTKLETL